MNGTWKRWLLIAAIAIGPINGIARADASVTLKSPKDGLSLQIYLVSADPFDPAHKVNNSAATPVTVARGETLRLIVVGKLKQGYHTYPFAKLADKQDLAFLSRIQFVVPPGLQPLWPGEETPPEMKRGPEGDLLEHDKDFSWTQDILVLPTAVPGQQQLELGLRLQVCDKGSCAVFTPKVKLSFEVSAGAAVALSPVLEKHRSQPIPELQERAGWRVEKQETIAKQPAGKDLVPAPAPKSIASDGIAGTQESYKQFMVDTLPELLNLPENKKLITQQSDTGLWFFVLMGMFWGAISLVTPCVFPMIPITVSFFLKQSEKAHHRPLTLAAVYSLTIVVVLTLAAALFINFFRWLSINPITNYLIGALFIYFALSLFGMYEIELPSGLARFTSAREGKGGMAGTMFMALTFTIISFACVAPFLGGFAGTAASNRPWWQMLLGGLAFSITFAAPFFFLALFPAMLRKLPRSGSWLNTVKVVMGFLEIAAALKFLRAAELLSTSTPSYFTFDLVLGMYVAIALLCGLYLLNLFRLPHDSPVEHLGVPRLLFALAFITLGLYLLPGLFKFSAEGEHQRPRGTVYAWVESFLLPEARQAGKIGNLELAIAQAREQGRKTGQPKRIFLDFTGFS